MYTSPVSSAHNPARSAASMLYALLPDASLPVDSHAGAELQASLSSQLLASTPRAASTEPHQPRPCCAQASPAAAVLNARAGHAGPHKGVLAHALLVAGHLQLLLDLCVPQGWVCKCRV